MVAIVGQCHLHGVASAAVDMSGQLINQVRKLNVVHSSNRLVLGAHFRLHEGNTIGYY